MASVEASDGIVYVERGQCGHNIVACLSLHVTPAAEYRILRASIDTRQSDWDLMASIGHELRHALEVLDDRTLTTSDAVFQFYSREGTMTDRAFETTAAIEAGHAVRNEVGSSGRRK